MKWSQFRVCPFWLRRLRVFSHALRRYEEQKRGVVIAEMPSQLTSGFLCQHFFFAQHSALRTFPRSSLQPQNECRTLPTPKRIDASQFVSSLSTQDFLSQPESLYENLQNEPIHWFAKDWGQPILKLPKTLFSCFPITQPHHWVHTECVMIFRDGWIATVTFLRNLFSR